MNALPKISISQVCTPIVKLPLLSQNAFPESKLPLLSTD